MKAEVEVFKGKKIEQIYKDIQEKHGGNYKLLEQRKNKRFLWLSDYEVKIAVGSLKKEPVKNVMEQKEKNQELIRAIVSGTSSEKEEKEKRERETKEMETMKEMMEKMMQKIEKQEKGFLEEENEKVFAKYFTKLVEESDVEESLAKQMIQEIKVELEQSEWKNGQKIEEKLQKKITEKLNVTGPFDAEKTKTIALIGPTGVGKTTTLAKIAAILKQSNKRIGLISTDVYRIGAIEQLQTYANIMDSKMIEAKNPQELKEAIDYFKHVERVDQILIDTVGRSPMKMDSIEGIKEYLEISNPDHTALVLSSTQKYKDMLQILKNFEHVNIDSMIFTKLDETMSYGFILNILAKSGLSVSYVTDGQNVPKDIYAATSESLAKQIIDGDDHNGSSVITA